MAVQIDFFIGKVVEVKKDFITVVRNMPNNGNLSFVERSQLDARFDLRKMNTFMQVKVGDFGACQIIQQVNSKAIDTGFDGYYFAPCVENWDGVNVRLTDDFKIETNGKKYIFDGGQNGGMAKTPKLKEKINALEKEINDLKTAINAWVVVPQDGGQALKLALETWIAQQIVPTQLSEIENDKIQH